MTTFKYKAISNSGAQVTGVVEAYDEFEAINKIKETCRIVTKISPVSALLESKDLLPPLSVSHKSLALMCSQFSIILSAGLPMLRTVELIAGQTSDRSLKKILVQTAQDVAAGYSLAQSLENKGKILPVTFIETVRAGEESGTLEASFKKLYQYYDKSAKIKAKVASAMAYPAFLCVVALLVIAVIMMVAVPMFTKMFASMDIELPLPTRILIAVSGFFTNYGLFLLLFLAALAIALKVYSATEKGRLAFARLKLRLPLLGNVALMQGASQFANTMSTLLSSGLPMVRAVAVTGRVLSNYAIGLAVGATVSGLEEGKSLGECMSKLTYFPALLVEMTAVGEETGSLEDTLDVIGSYYDNEVEVTTARVISMLEPTITVIMAGMAMMILLSVYLPMFSMYGSL